jgi:hypothetical protein
MNSHADVFPEVRIFLVSDESVEEIDHYISSLVPRIGEYICIQHEFAEVCRVEWTIIQRKPFADVFCRK